MAAYQVLLLNTAVPQIQAAQSGDTYVCPRDIQITANLDVTGNTILGDASTDTVRVNGYMGVGGAASSAYTLLFTGGSTSGNNQYGVGNTINHNLSGTTWSAAFLSNGSIAASTAVTNAAAYRSINMSLGSGATISNQHGVHIGDLTSGTNNYGITSLVSSGTNKWNIYASGTAANYFAGNVGIGTSSPQTQLELSSNNGAGTALNILRFNDADTTSSPDQPTGKIEFYINDATAGGTGVASYIMGHAVNTAGGGYLTFATSPNGATGAIERLRIEFNGGLITKPAANGHAVFNEDGVDADFRVESDTDTHALFVQGSDGFVGIGTSSPGAQLDIAGTVHVTNANSFISSSTACLFARTSGAGSGIFGEAGHLVLQPRSSAVRSIIFGTGSTTATERARFDGVGNFLLNGSVSPTSGVGTFAIFNGTAPTASVANGIILYAEDVSSSSELKVRDEAGNVTTLSPHNFSLIPEGPSEDMAWAYYSEKGGKRINVDMLKLARMVEKLTGEKLVYEN